LTFSFKIFKFVNYENLNHGDITFQNMKQNNLHIISMLTFVPCVIARGFDNANSPWFNRRNL